MKPYFRELQIGQFFNPKIHGIAWDPDTMWVEYFNFTATPIPIEMLRADPFYDWLFKRHPFRGGILKMENKEVYNWHEDSNRGVCINCMIPTPNTSYTFFRAKYKPGANIVQHKIIELQYYPGVRYLFNNQQQHMVLNYDGVRFMITIEFEADKNKLTFDDLSLDIEKNYER